MAESEGSHSWLWSVLFTAPYSLHSPGRQAGGSSPCREGSQALLFRGEAYVEVGDPLNQNPCAAGVPPALRSLS